MPKPDHLPPGLRRDLPSPDCRRPFGGSPTLGEIWLALMNALLFFVEFAAQGRADDAPLQRRLQVLEDVRFNMARGFEALEAELRGGRLT